MAKINKKSFDKAVIIAQSKGWKKASQLKPTDNKTDLIQTFRKGNRYIWITKDLVKSKIISKDYVHDGKNAQQLNDFFTKLK